MTKHISEHTLIDLYQFLFIFSMINREFLLFGLDLRFILIFLGVVLLFIFMKKGQKPHLNKFEKTFVLFYIFLFLSNLFLVFSINTVNVSEWIRLNILHANNFLFLLTIICYKKEVNKNKAINYYKISMIVLMISFVMILFKIDIPSMFCGVEHMYVKGKEHVNLFGGHIRIAGFAEDANYAFLFFFTFFILILSEGFKKSSVIYLILSVIGMGYSFSKTQVIMAVPVILFFFAYKYLNVRTEYKNIALLVVLICIFCLPFIMSKLNVMGNMVTMENRYALWNNALKLFKENHYFPAGIGGLRFYNSATLSWKVQAHSTYVQVLVELGLIGVILYVLLAYFSLNGLKNIYFIITMNFLMFSVTSETLYLQFFVFAFYYLPLLCKKKGVKTVNTKKVLFFVNSLGSGGAERVCDNLAFEYVKEGYSVDFVVLFDNQQYPTRKEYNVLSLHLNQSLGKAKLIASMLKKRKEINQFIKSSEKDGIYQIVMAHLPMSHICASLTDVGSRCLYVQHISLKSEGRFYSLYKAFYKNKKNVCVSEGLKNEFINTMNYKPENVSVVYNPVSADDIRTQAQGSFQTGYQPYFLCVGRLTQQKRFDRAIEVFYQGDFYQKYYLVIVGQGEKEEELRQLTIKYGIQDRVIFTGWQNNVYQWMRNAELLLHTSEREALPMVLIEALASGTRVVASNCDYGSDEILTGDYGRFIAEQDNVSDYIEKIHSALTSFEIHDSYEILDECKADYVCEQYLNVYQESFRQ